MNSLELKLLGNPRLPPVNHSAVDASIEHLIPVLIDNMEPQITLLETERLFSRVSTVAEPVWNKVRRCQAVLSILEKDSNRL